MPNDNLTWNDITLAAVELASRWQTRTVGSVYGIPTGGAPVAILVAQALDVPLTEKPGKNTLVVDDLIDTGNTIRPYADLGHHTDTLYRKPWSPPDLCPDATLRTGWLRFPWEADDGDPIDAVTRLIQYIGEDPTRDGLRETPTRVVKALTELTSGYTTNVAELLAVTFTEDHDELIVVRHVPFHSLCEHHMLPFHGHATIGYVPREGHGIVGLSKLARLVDVYARRLQVQERLTDQIAQALTDHLHPLAVGVIIEATHTCMSMRGINKTATMTTSRLTGLLRERPDLRHEFFTLATTH